MKKYLSFFVNKTKIVVRRNYNYSTIHVIFKTENKLFVVTVLEKN